MRVYFRVDASQSIGTGHVFRCLTLARELQNRGATCSFVCAAHPGHMGASLQDLGHTVHLLDRAPASAPMLVQADDPPHLGWLGCSQEEDAAQTLQALVTAGREAPDWWVLDHYGLDARWETAVRGASRLLVIDDLADRVHRCDVLTDPGLLRRAGDYTSLVSPDTRLCLGPTHALLREEFRAHRAASLARRAQPRLQQLLVFMGGMDPQGATRHVLHTLLACGLPSEVQVTVVMGAQAPTLGEVQALMRVAPGHWSLLTQVSDMARLMVQADLAIGACGTTVWERACLGLPSVCAVLADNQITVGEGLRSAHLAWVLQGVEGLGEPLRCLLTQLLHKPQDLVEVSQNSASATQGLGAKLLVDAMMSAPCDPIQP
jgi:UDP-2,4-diacetamido-2,4,6-trideoxy-beta-L-altropyranose hydrolase